MEDDGLGPARGCLNGLAISVVIYALIALAWKVGG